MTRNGDVSFTGSLRHTLVPKPQYLYNDPSEKRTVPYVQQTDCLPVHEQNMLSTLTQWISDLRLKLCLLALPGKHRVALFSPVWLSMREEMRGYEELVSIESHPKSSRQHCNTLFEGHQ
jgi:hypothetical protein